MKTQAPLTGEIEYLRQGAVGIIRLNRPQAINALNRAMVEAVTAVLASAADDPAVRVVLFEGAGERGFCAGGDVRALRSDVLAGHPEAAIGYLAAEYAMNARIAHFPKPTVVIAHGATMGGGIGIAGHCRFRFALPGAKFAMPETAIGFVPDVGANYLLARAPRHRALAFLLAGVPVPLADALQLGLTDCRIAEGRADAVREAIVAAAGAPDPVRALAHLVEAETTHPGEAQLGPAADALADRDPSNLAGFVAALRELPGLDVVARRSPTSLAAAAVTQLAARRLPGIDAVLALELRVGGWLVRRPDFAEGVRAVLVDKDHAPRWSPERVEAVDIAEIEAIASP